MLQPQPAHTRVCNTKVASSISTSFKTSPRCHADQKQHQRKCPQCSSVQDNTDIAKGILCKSFQGSHHTSETPQPSNSAQGIIKRSFRTKAMSTRTTIGDASTYFCHIRIMVTYVLLKTVL